MKCKANNILISINFLVFIVVTVGSIKLKTDFEQLKQQAVDKGYALYDPESGWRWKEEGE